MINPDSIFVLAIGFLSQSLFGVRIIVQLFFSERERTTSAHVIFWQLSLMASALLLVYGVLRSDPVIIIGQILNYFIYIRNLQLQNQWNIISRQIRLLLMALPILICLSDLSIYNAVNIGFKSNSLIYIVGIVGQLLLNLRFAYQWIQSEKVSSSVFPPAFWLISIVGSVLVIVYATFHPKHDVDLVLLVAQVMAIAVYTRQFVLVRT